MSNTKTVERIEAFKKEFLAEGSECTWKDYPLATDVLDWLRLQEQNFHQELQKARDEALAREKQLKQVHMMELDAISCKSIEDFVIWRDHRKQRPNQSELDQPK